MTNVLLKTDEEIELMRLSNLLVSKTHAVLVPYMKPGTSTLTLDKIAEQFIRDNGGVPGFLGYNNFPNTLCISINKQVVHGIPSGNLLREGDIVSVDCGVVMNGFYGDSAYTFAIGDIRPEYQKLLQVTKECLFKGIENAIVGKRIGDISYAIQQHAETNGFSIVRELVGHGVGRKLHEKPEVPNYGKRGQGPVLKEGMVIAIEPMVNFGKRYVAEGEDGWTINTADGLPSAHFEHTVAVRKGKADILSDFSFIEQILNKPV